MAQKSETRCGQQRASINFIGGNDEMSDKSIPEVSSAIHRLEHSCQVGS